MKAIILSIYLLTNLFITQRSSVSFYNPNPIDTDKVFDFLKKSKSSQETSPEDAIHFAIEGLLLSQKIHFLIGKGKLLDQLAFLNEKYNHLDVAIDYQKQALLVFTKLKMQKNQAISNYSLGKLNVKKKDLNAAIPYLNNALTIFRKLKDISGIISCYKMLGNINDIQGNKEEAVSYYLQAQKLLLNKPTSEDYFMVLKSLGMIYQKSGMQEKAMAYFNEGIKKSDDRKFATTHIRFLKKAGTLHDSLGNKSLALDFHKQALEKARQFHLPEEEANALIRIAKSIREVDADQSIKHLNNALFIAKGIKNKQLASEIYNSLSDIYKQQAKFKEALYALNEHHKLLDSLLILKRGHEIAIMKGNYELETSKEKVQSLELKNERSIVERNTILSIAIVILTVLLAVWFYVYRTRKLNKSLAESNQIKDRLFSIIGHDLRNPIGGITQMLTLLEEEPMTQDQQQMIILMRKQGQVVGEILNSLLDWGKMQLNGIEVKHSMFNPKPLIMKNIDLLFKQAADKNIHIKDCTSAEIRLYGDADHFDFVIRNLLSNAIKFSFPGGNIEITTEELSSSDKIVFAVIDNGKGISKEQKEQFNRKNLEVSYGTAGEKGTGIGLALSKEFVKANRGSIYIRDTESGGSTFCFSFEKG